MKTTRKLSSALLAMLGLLLISANAQAAWIPLDTGGATAWVESSPDTSPPPPTEPLASVNFLHALHQVVYARNATSAELTRWTSSTESAAAIGVFAQLTDKDGLGGTKPVNLAHVANNAYVEPALIERTFVYPSAGGNTNLSIYLQNRSAPNYDGIAIHGPTSNVYQVWSAANLSQASMNALHGILHSSPWQNRPQASSISAYTSSSGDVVYMSNGTLFRNQSSVGASELITDASMVSESGASQRVNVSEGRLTVGADTVPFIKVDSGGISQLGQPPGTVALTVRFNPPNVNKSVQTEKGEKIVPVLMAAVLFARVGLVGARGFTFGRGFFQGLAGAGSSNAILGVGRIGAATLAEPAYITAARIAGFRFYEGNAFYASGVGVGIAHNTGFIAGHALRYGSGSVRLVGGASPAAGSILNIELSTALTTGLIRGGMLLGAGSSFLTGDTTPQWSNNPVFFGSVLPSPGYGFTYTPLTGGGPVSLSGNMIGPSVYNFPIQFVNTYPW